MQTNLAWSDKSFLIKQMELEPGGKNLRLRLLVISEGMVIILAVLITVV